MSLAGQASGQLVAVVRTANRIDYWIRRRVHATDLILLISGLHRIALIDRG